MMKEQIVHRVSNSARRTKHDPDASLVKRIGQGDQRAAAVLVQRHLPKIVTFARNMLGDANEAEDVAQEVFMKVWQHAKNWTPGRAKFATWMHRITINLCYDRLRRRREVYTDQLPERADEDSPGADQRIINAQMSMQVENAMMHLPPRQRAALTLCHLQEMSNIEAARSMKVSVEALESLLARGRKNLRELLTHEVKALLEN